MSKASKEDVRAYIEHKEGKPLIGSFWTDSSYSCLRVDMKDLCFVHENKKLLDEVILEMKVEKFIEQIKDIKGY